MVRYMQEFISYLEANNKNYFDVIEERSKIIYRTGGDHVSDLPVQVMFKEDSEVAKLYLFNLCKYGPEKAQAMYKVVNDLNMEYVGMTFCADDSDNTITVKNSIRIGYPGWEEHLYREIKLVSSCADEEYPKLMKAIWSD